MQSRRPTIRNNDPGEFLWLISLSDLMMLLFVFFVVIFSFTYRKLGQGDFQRMAEILTSRMKKATPLDEVQAKLLKWVVDKKLLDDITVEQKEDALILHIKEKILFNPGEYALTSDGIELIRLIGLALHKIPAPYRIGVEGHTDDVPIHSKDIADNWELSAKRAHSVLIALNLDEELKKRALIMGYGEMKPLVPNRDAKGNAIPANQSKNRRVTIRIF